MLSLEQNKNLNEALVRSSSVLKLVTQFTEWLNVLDEEIPRNVCIITITDLQQQNKRIQVCMKYANVCNKKIKDDDGFRNDSEL